MFREFIKNGYRHPHANTLSECLEWAAAKCTKGINFYTFDGKSTFLSYNDILEKAKIWAGTLRKKNINGSVIICIDDPETFTITLWACIISGIVVVPIEGLRNAEIQSGDYSRICNICKQHPGCVIASDSMRHRRMAGWRCLVQRIILLIVILQRPSSLHVQGLGWDFQGIGNILILRGYVREKG